MTTGYMTTREPDDQTRKRDGLTRGFARRATLWRSVRLLAAFRHEREDPERFYGLLAADTAEMVESLYAGATGLTLGGATVLDVGGGPGYFASEFAARGARYLPVEPDPTEMHAAGLRVRGAVRGSGMALPFRDGAVDVCLSSNVAEHVSQPWLMADEMLRVTRLGGLMVLSYTVWRGPFGGHETGPWHYFGGDYARQRYERKHGHPPKNRFGESLFSVRADAGLQWAGNLATTHIWGAFPRYHPRWAWPLVQMPRAREVLVSNLVLVVRK